MLAACRYVMWCTWCGQYLITTVQLSCVTAVRCAVYASRCLACGNSLSRLNCLNLASIAACSMSIAKNYAVVVNCCSYVMVSCELLVSMW